MARGRKTFQVKTMIEEFNRQLANPELTQEQKQVICSLAEQLLLDTNNYKGFTHIKWMQEGAKEWTQDKAEGKVEEGDFEAKAKYIGPEYDRYYHI